MEQDNKENQTPEVKYKETEEQEVVDEHEQTVLETHKEEPKKENKSSFDAALLAGILGALIILALIIFFVLVY